MKTFSERHTNELARRPAASADAPSGITASARPHARDVAQRERIDSAFGTPLQRVDDEEDLQRKTEGPLQRQADEEEKSLQGRFDLVQRLASEEEEPLQVRTEAHPGPGVGEGTAARPGGLPAGLRNGIEALSGMDVSDVRVHTGSSKPAEINALAYTRGADIHVAPGQEQHLAHEAWHVVQQRQGRVHPTMLLRGIGINDDASLETEADRMGEQARRINNPSI